MLAALRLPSAAATAHLIHPAAGATLQGVVHFPGSLLHPATPVDLLHRLFYRFSVFPDRYFGRLYFVLSGYRYRLNYYHPDFFKKASKGIWDNIKDKKPYGEVNKQRLRKI